MCGICGFVNFDGQVVDEKIGYHMVEILHHRGPDGKGCYVKQPTISNTSSIFLGHTRLKVIDLTESAKQPLSNEDGKIWIVFNGEIYNFRELRKLLEAKGHLFRSRSDTEVIVHAYEEFGTGVLKHLDGMFAFAIWDETKKSLFLARDRTGKKPLYYHFKDNRFTFGSEIKALLVCPWVKRCVAVEQIPEYLFYGFVPTPRTLYRNIFQVPPASYMIVDKDGLKGPYKYWQLQFSEYPVHFSIKESVDQVRQILTSAVAKRCVSDVPFGALLSGGLDSSIVVGLMTQILRTPVRTFSIGFIEDKSFDERPYAAIVAQHFNTEHTEFVVRLDATRLMERILWHYDQPYGDSSAIPTYLLSRLARQYVTVALNGDGGDEVFAGYDRFRAALIAEDIPSCFWVVGRLVSRMLPWQYGYYSLRRRMERFFDSHQNSIQEKYLDWIAIFNHSLLYEILHPDVRAKADENKVKEIAYQYFGAACSLSTLHQLLYLNFMTYLPDDLNVKMDRMSMANSLETRSPMLDTALIEFVATLPPHMKIHRWQTKYILKLAFKGLLPPKILRRKKHGFGVPLGLWFRHDLGRQFEELVLSNQARSQMYLNHNVMRRIYYEHLNGMHDHSYRLWALLQLELWLRMLEQDPNCRPGLKDYEIPEVIEVNQH